MRRLISSFVCLFYYLAPTIEVHSQENAQWAFYLAFEDASGAKDTVWLVMDEQASINTQDFEYNEIAIDIVEDSFNVWVYNFFDWENPYDCFAIDFGSADIEIFANNFVLPLQLSWDSTLFQADIVHDVLGYGANLALLENQYFSDFGEFGYIMLDSETIEMPFFSWGSGDHFPLEFRIQFGLGDPLSSKELEKQKLELFPNPIQNKLNFATDSQLEYFEIYSIGGELVYSLSLFNNQSDSYSFDVSKLSSGMYVAVGQFEEGVLTGKFVKE